jgi:septal ring factor EnvC (AmiA/AmiB activator)
MSDLKPSVRLLATRLTTITDNALKTLQDFHAALESLAERAGEVESLETRAREAKTQLANVQAQLDMTWRELEQMKEAHSKTAVELGSAAAQFAEIKTRLGAM